MLHRPCSGCPHISKLPHKIEPTSAWKYAKCSAQGVGVAVSVGVGCGSHGSVDADANKQEKV